MGNKTPDDLIKQLNDEIDSGRVNWIALVVAFPDKDTEYVYSTEPERSRLAKLNNIIARGGQPIGFLATARERSGKFTMKRTLLDEYAHQVWAQVFLASVEADCLRDLERKGLVKVEPGEN